MAENGLETDEMAWPENVLLNRKSKMRRLSLRCWIWCRILSSSYVVAIALTIDHKSRAALNLSSLVTKICVPSFSIILMADF